MDVKDEGIKGAGVEQVAAACWRGYDGAAAGAREGDAVRRR